MLYGAGLGLGGAIVYTVHASGYDLNNIGMNKHEENILLMLGMNHVFRKGCDNVNLKMQHLSHLPLKM